MVPINNLLYHLMRGTVKSVPLVGALLEELLFGAFEAAKRDKESKKLWELLSNIEKKLATFEEIVSLINENQIKNHIFNKAKDILQSDPLNIIGIKKTISIDKKMKQKMKRLLNQLH